MKVVKWLVTIALAIVAVVVVASYLYLRATLPEYNGTVALQGVHAPVEIVRDSYGVPHIFAENQEDAYLALGYCMAQDRLVQIEIIRLLSQGRLSELMGPATVDVDRLFRTIHRAHDLEKAESMRSRLVAPIENAFIRGINAYLEQGDPLPMPFPVLHYRPEPYTHKDIFSLMPLYAWMTTRPLRPELIKAAVIEKVGPEMAEELYTAHKKYPTTIPEGEPCYPGFTGFPAPAPTEKATALDRKTGEAALGLLSMTRDVSRTLDTLGVHQAKSACNSLVVSAEKTGTGKPLLAQDFHFPYVVPSYLYEASISTPTNKVAGYIFAGLPYVLGGQNEHVAWVFTAGAGDQVDVYIEKLDPDDPNKYLYRGEYEEMTVKKEVIKVRGGEDVEIEVRLTRHGPVMDDLIKDSLKPELNGTSIALRLASVDSFRESEALYRMNTARNADDFVAAMQFYKSPDEHWIYADDSGEIGYIYGGALPARNGFDGSLPLPGWTGEFEWDGYVPTAMQPQLRNPKMGFINTSNTRPAPDYYPYPQGNTYVQSDRMQRVREDISEAIAEKGTFSAADTQKVFADYTILRAREWVPPLLDAAEGAQLNPNEKNGLDLLAHWDFVSDKDSAPAMIFQATLVQMVRNAFEDKLGEQLYGELIHDRGADKWLKNIMPLENSPWFDDPTTPAVEDRADFFLKSFKEGVKSLEERLGPDPAAWHLGDLLTLTLRSPLGRAVPSLASVFDIGPMSVSGGIIAPYQTSYGFDKPYEVTVGTQARFVVDFSDRRNSGIVNMPGISGNFMSPHYSDQVKMWQDFQFRPLVLYREEADQDAKYHMTLLSR